MRTQSSTRSGQRPASTSHIRQQETFAETMRRLAVKARLGGCELYQDEITGAWFATSRRNPMQLH